MKARHQVERLKLAWLADPLWDIEDTEGFEKHHDELVLFREATQARWKAAEQAREAAIDAEADRLGVHGLLRLLRRVEELQHRHNAALQHLTDGRIQDAWLALTGSEQER